MIYIVKTMACDKEESFIVVADNTFDAAFIAHASLWLPLKPFDVKDYDVSVYNRKPITSRSDVVGVGPWTNEVFEEKRKEALESFNKDNKPVEFSDSKKTSTEKSDKHMLQLKPNGKMKELADSLHVLRGKSFRVKVTSNTRSNLAHIKGTKDYLESHTFLIGDELLVQGYYDGFSQWYGVDSRLNDFANWVSEGRVALNVCQTKSTSIKPAYIEYLKKHKQWKD